ncbi:Mg2+ transporter protein, CorA-like/Zinc transport protein ZntB [Corchorus capsularis]|uniref:Mg2+ transporter protein, CorA-like/Zinc transport protein ZntB n=2 Tax=Corchorus TaxID=93758 RepID=A0A1R3JGD2_COCAP|nr:Mg2+ transporter protein, CorA-like/Zinc transport protein ZntB [Corchorus capsularis]
MKVQTPANGQTEASSTRLDGQKVNEPSSSYESRERENVAVSFEEYRDGQSLQLGQFPAMERYDGSCWVPIGWERISELVKNVQVNGGWASQQFDLMDNEEDFTVADLAAPYWERPAGPIWWCHLAAGHPTAVSWLSNAQWLHPAVSLALRDESRLISERMKHLLYEVPVRVAGGLLFELLGQSAGDPFNEEDDIPVVLRSWQAHNFLLTVLHIKGNVSSVNVLGIAEVQELLSAGGHNVPRTVHEVIAHLACRLTRWDDRLFRKSIFGAADEIELMFMNRRNREDMNLFGVILNQEIRRLSKQVIRVKWSLHAREEIVFELLQHLRGNAARVLLEGIRKSTREMIEEQEAVRGRLFTIQDVMQSTIRAWLQDRSLRVTHNLAVFGGVGLVLTIITGLFGINVDGIPGAANTPYAFGLFTAILVVIGIVLIIIGLIYLGLKHPINLEQAQVRKLELQELVKMFQHEAEAHAQVRKNTERNNLTPTTGDGFLDDAEYILIQ